MPGIRTFIAIEIPDAVRQEIAQVQEQLKKSEERISWTKPGNIHLTLKFLGDVDENRIPAVIEAVAQAVESMPAFRFNIRGIGAFPNIRGPRVLWVGVENETNELLRIADNLEEELAQLGFAKEKRKFSPHLTIARVRSSVSRGFVEAFQQVTFDAGEVEATEVAVIKSQLQPQGAIYTPLQKIKLRTK